MAACVMRPTTRCAVGLFPGRRLSFARLTGRLRHHECVESCGGDRGADDACLTEAGHDLAVPIRAVAQRRPPAFLARESPVRAALKEEVGDKILDVRRNFHPAGNAVSPLFKRAPSGEMSTPRTASVELRAKRMAQWSLGLRAEDGERKSQGPPKHNCGNITIPTRAAVSPRQVRGKGEPKNELISCPCLSLSASPTKSRRRSPMVANPAWFSPCRAGLPWCRPAGLFLCSRICRLTPSFLWTPDSLSIPR